MCYSRWLEWVQTVSVNSAWMPNGVPGQLECLPAQKLPRGLASLDGANELAASPSVE